MEFVNYSSVRTNIIKIFPLELINKYLIPYHHNLEIEVIPSSVKNPVELIVNFFEMNCAHHKIYNICKSIDTEFLNEEKYECNSVNINIGSFPFSLVPSEFSMGAYHFVVKLHTFKCSQFTANIMYIDFTPVRYLSLYFVTITKLINILNRINTNTNEEYSCYSNREQLLLFLNGYSGYTKEKKYRVLGDPFWHRSISEYLCFDNYTIDYKGEEYYSNYY